MCKHKYFKIIFAQIFDSTNIYTNMCTNISINIKIANICEHICDFSQIFAQIFVQMSQLILSQVAGHDRDPPPDPLAATLPPYFPLIS